MTGMKEGAGEDPFADTSDTGDNEPVEQETETKKTPSETHEEEEHTRQASESHPTSQQIQIPYKFRRDGVQDNRDRVPLFLMQETKQAERDALREMEERFGDNVSLTDLREAVMRAGLSELDTVENTLQEWGYGMTFNE